MFAPQAWARLFSLLILAAACAQARAATPAGKYPTTPPSDYIPDPASVTREGAGYRYPQAGWIVVHIEGEPYERGYQHGRLLAAEIADYISSDRRRAQPPSARRSLGATSACWSMPCSCAATTRNTCTR